MKDNQKIFENLLMAVKQKEKHPYTMQLKRRIMSCCKNFVPKTLILTHEIMTAWITFTIFANITVKILLTVNTSRISSRIVQKAFHSRYTLGAISKRHLWFMPLPMRTLMKHFWKLFLTIVKQTILSVVNLHVEFLREFVNLNAKHLWLLLSCHVMK